jgi:predicted N-acetyltransferase YhbS
MKGSFANDVLLSTRIFDLLETAFPGMRQTAANAAALGGPWESASTPFVHCENGRVLSHVGVIELSLVLLGEPVAVGSIHGVVTDPAARRRGYYRRLIGEALDYCAGRYQTLMLTTEHPEYFEPFGFRVVQEHLFRVACRSRGDGDGFRLLDRNDPADVRRLNHLLETREPVSEVAGVVKDKAVFCFNEGSRPLHYAEDLDVVVCLELEERRLKLFDVVGRAIPPLARLLERLPRPIDEVEICFSPDRLAVEAEASPHVLDMDGPSYLMVHGDFLPDHRTFTLPRSART